jgi:hypothetical protein
MGLLALLIVLLFFKCIRECFAFAEGLACGWGKAKCATCGWAKIVLKKCGWKKIKNTGSAMSVGLLVVRLKYGLYVVHLSKWFVLVLMFNF